LTSTNEAADTGLVGLSPKGEVLWSLPCLSCCSPPHLSTAQTMEIMVQKMSISSWSVAGGLTQRLRGHQSFWEARLLSKPAPTQQTRVQRLSPENKWGFSYIPFRPGYRNGGWVQLVPYIITCYFIGYFNLRAR
jgi:hypothetical protein